MIGGHRVAEQGEHAGLADGLDRPGLRRQADEEGRLLDVGRVGLPFIDRPALDRNLIPLRAEGVDIGVHCAVIFRIVGKTQGRLQFLRRGPDIRQIDRLAVLADAQRFCRQVEVHRAGQGVGDHQGGRGEIIGLDQGVDAPLEIAVAAEHRRRHQLVTLDRRADRLGQGTAVADAGGAAVADHRETKLLQPGQQAALLEIGGDHARTRGEAGLDPRFLLQSLLDRLFGEQAGPDHHRGVGGVGAAGDRGDDHAAVLQGDLLPLQLDLDLFVQFFRGQIETALLGRSAEGGFEGAADLREGDAVLRPLGAGQAGLDRAEVKLEGVGEKGIGGLIAAEEPLLLVVALHQVDQLTGAACAGEVSEAFGVHGEKAHSGAVLRGHVGDQGTVGQGDLREAAAVEFDELADYSLFAQHLGDGEGDVGRSGFGAQAAAEAESDHLGHEHVEGLAEHHRLGLDAADAPGDDAEAVDHGGVRVGADQAVGIGHPALRRVGRENAAGEIFKVDLVDDADPGGDDLEGLEGLLAPFEELVAFAVALELDLHIAAEGLAAAEGVDLDGVVDDQFGWDEGLDLFGVAAHALHG